MDAAGSTKFGTALTADCAAYAEIGVPEIFVVRPYQFFGG